MAARFPLIANSSANQIQELASGDDMDLTGSSITGAGIITATSFSGSGANLTGIPTSYVDAINITASGITTTNGLLDANAEVTAAGGVDIAGGFKVAGITTLATDVRIGTGASIFQPASNALTVGTASTEVVRINANAGILLNNGILAERVKIDSDSINSDKFIRLQDGMVHYRSSAVGAASV